MRLLRLNLLPEIALLVLVQRVEQVGERVHGRDDERVLRHLIVSRCSREQLPQPCAVSGSHEGSPAWISAALMNDSAASWNVCARSVSSSHGHTGGCAQLHRPSPRTCQYPDGKRRTVRASSCRAYSGRKSQSRQQHVAAWLTSPPRLRRQAGQAAAPAPRRPRCVARRDGRGRRSSTTSWALGRRPSTVYD